MKFRQFSEYSEIDLTPMFIINPFLLQFNPKYMMMASACSVMSFWLPSVDDEVQNVECSSRCPAVIFIISVFPYFIALKKNQNVSISSSIFTELEQMKSILQKFKYNNINSSNSFRLESFFFYIEPIFAECFY